MQQSRQRIAVGLFLAGIGAAIPLGLSAGSTRPPAATDTVSLPSRVTLNAVVRGFAARGEAAGHPDFETFAGPRPTVGLVEETLGVKGVPILANNGIGRLIAREWVDDRGRPIRPASYGAAWGDAAGRYGNTNHRQVTNAESFGAWFTDTSAARTTEPVDLRLTRRPGSTMFVMDSAMDEPWRARGGFFPLQTENGQGEYFTTQITADFVHEAGAGHVLRLTTSGDAWVFIDGRLVLDLGGQHPSAEQAVALDRLTWVRDGHVHRISIFMAHRQRGESTLRLETTLLLRPADGMDRAPR